MKFETAINAVQNQINIEQNNLQAIEDKINDFSYYSLRDQRNNLMFKQDKLRVAISFHDYGWEVMRPQKLATTKEELAKINRDIARIEKKMASFDIAKETNKQTEIESKIKDLKKELLNLKMISIK